MSLKFTAGDLTIHCLIEEETTFLPVHDLFAGLTLDLLAENRISVSVASIAPESRSHCVWPKY